MFYFVSFHCDMPDLLFVLYSTARLTLTLWLSTVYCLRARWKVSKERGEKNIRYCRYSNMLLSSLSLSLIWCDWSCRQGIKNQSINHSSQINQSSHCALLIHVTTVRVFKNEFLSQRRNRSQDRVNEHYMKWHDMARRRDTELEITYRYTLMSGAIDSTTIDDSFLEF